MLIASIQRYVIVDCSKWVVEKCMKWLKCFEMHCMKWLMALMAIKWFKYCWDN